MSEVHLLNRTSFISPLRFQLTKLSTDCGDYMAAVEENSSTSSGIREIL